MQLIEYGESAGSSPRVRGKPRPLRGASLSPGLIPACAGKTTWPFLWSRPSRAHPRVCGENPTSDGASLTQAGSSPRVRGKRHGPADAALPGRLIPACAGKTTTPEVKREPSRARPRVCGENRCGGRRRCRGGGSSPRVRGKPVARAAVDAASGLIPACAGKTRAVQVLADQRLAHPRVCGENGEFTVKAVQL